MHPQIAEGQVTWLPEASTIDKSDNFDMIDQPLWKVCLMIPESTIGESHAITMVKWVVKFL